MWQGRGQEEDLLFIKTFLWAFLQIPLNPHSNLVRQEDTEAQLNTLLDFPCYDQPR